MYLLLFFVMDLARRYPIDEEDLPCQFDVESFEYHFCKAFSRLLKQMDVIELLGLVTPGEPFAEGTRGLISWLDFLTCVQ